MDKSAVRRAADTHQALVTAGFTVISEAEAREARLSICGGVDRDVPKEMTREDWLFRIREIASSGTSPRGARIIALSVPPDRIFDQPSKKDLAARDFEELLGDLL